MIRQYIVQYSTAHKIYWLKLQKLHQVKVTVKFTMKMPKFTLNAYSKNGFYCLTENNNILRLFDMERHVIPDIRCNILKCCLAKVSDKSGLDEIIVKRQPYQLLSTSREFFPSFDASNFHKLVNESS